MVDNNTYCDGIYQGDLIGGRSFSSKPIMIDVLVIQT